MNLTIKVEGPRASGKTRLLNSIIHALETNPTYRVRRYTFAEGVGIERNGSETLTMEITGTRNEPETDN